MPKSKPYILLTLLLWGTTICAQTPIVHTFNKFENFSATHIYDIDQSHEGYIYIASNTGIYRFDGLIFKNISKENGLSISKFTNIFIDKDSLIWVSEINGRTWRIENDKLILQKSSKPFPKSALAPIKDTYQKIGDTLSFITYSQSQYKFLNDTLYEHKKISADQTIFHIIRPFHNKWRRHLALYLQVNKNKLFQDHRLRLGYASGYSNDSSFMLCLGNLKLYNDNETIKYKFENKSYFSAITINNQTLIGKQNEGLLILKDNVPTDTLLKDIVVTELFADSNNGLWVGTQSDGLMYIPSLEYNVYKPSYEWGHTKITDILNIGDQIISLEKHKELKSLDAENKNFTHILTLPIKANEIIYENDNSILLYGEYQALIIRKSKNRFVVDRSFSLKKPIYKAAINDNHLYFSSLDGITIYNILNKKIVDTILSNQRIWNLCEWNNKIYAGNNNGLWEINRENQVVEISSNRVLHMNKTQNELIISYENNKLEIKSPTSNKTINLKEQVNINHIFKKDTLILLSSEKGLKTLNKNFNLCAQYDYLNKIPSNSNIKKSILFDDKILILNNNGLYSFPKNRPINRKKYPIQIHSKNNIRKDGQKVVLSVNKDEKHLHLSMSTFDYKSNNPPTLFYKIDQEKKINRIQNNELNITQMHSGVSHIEISDNMQFEHNHNYLDIEIQKTGYWYQNIYGQISSVSILGLLLALIIRYRLNMISRKNAYNTSRVTQLQTVLQQQMNPHFIFNSLTSINHFILQNKPLDSSKYLTKFSTLIRKILDNSSSEKVSLSEELEAISLYLELELLRFMDKFSFSVQKSPDVNENAIKIVPFLIQPYIDKAIKENILNKSDKGTILLQFRIIKNQLACSIIDNGINENEKVKDKYFNRAKSTKTSVQIAEQRIENYNKQNRHKIVITNEVLKNHMNETTGNKITINFPLNQ